mmetsp:Transcript_51286/g.102070  ORF Transcript_51286/g.102070 Transcript_51286/m.102070 type:complete len:88 (+) Transcript_51286:65-328(+)
MADNGPFYGDLRVRTDRSRGTCLFWVVPDVAPGFNAPPFYDDFVNERRAYLTAARSPLASPPPPPQQQQPEARRHYQGNQSARGRRR